MTSLDRTYLHLPQYESKGFDIRHQLLSFGAQLVPHRIKVPADKLIKTLGDRILHSNFISIELKHKNNLKTAMSS